MLQAIQIGLNTNDMAGTLRLYSEAFGFRNAGGQAAWGKVIGVQGLPPESRTMMWWMVGIQPFFQFELFTHAVPAQRPQPADWRPSDLGWVRFTVRLAGFDHCLAVLAEHGVKPISPPRVSKGARHAAVRDPYVGAIIELVEADEGPSVSSIACSVADLEAARRYYGELIGFPIRDLDTLRSEEDESLWGLDGARRDGFVVDAGGGVLLEIVRYSNPEGRPKPADHRISDQGIMNIAVAAHDRAPVAAAPGRLAGAGLVPPFTYDDGSTICGYIVGPDHEVEFTVVPEEAYSRFGFMAQGDFMG